ncbi:MAG: hypothetical protein GX198_06490 [Epulopiscium sp.]|nr:hypothetical protein [Candidatus Epulonipiscium sp.]
MRKYKAVPIEKEVIDEVYCNICGKKIEKVSPNQFEDYLHIEKLWGYHSKNDGKKDEIDVCQACYEKWINSFKISV